MLRKAFNINCACTLDPRPLPRNITPHLLEKIVNSTHLSHKEAKRLYKSFRRISSNGYIGFHQFKESLGMLGRCENTKIPERMFFAFDSNGDNKLDFLEYSTALGIMMKGSEDEKLELSFKILTSDVTTPNIHNGPSRIISNEFEYNEISLKDFIEIVHEVHLTRTALSGTVTEPVDESFVTNIFYELTTFDGSSTPTMSLTDFKKAAKSSPDFLSLLGIFTKDLYLDNPIKPISKLQSMKKRRSFSRESTEPKVEWLEEARSIKFNDYREDLKIELKSQIDKDLSDIRLEVSKIASLLTKEMSTDQKEENTLSEPHNNVPYDLSILGDTHSIKQTKETKPGLFESTLKPLTVPKLNLNSFGYRDLKLNQYPEELTVKTPESPSHLQHPQQKSLTASSSTLDKEPLMSTELTNSIYEKLNNLSSLIDTYGISDPLPLSSSTLPRQKSYSVSNFCQPIKLAIQSSSPVTLLSPTPSAPEPHIQFSEIEPKLDIARSVYQPITRLSIKGDELPMHINRFSSTISTNHSRIQRFSRMGKRSVKRISQFQNPKGFQGFAVHFGHQSWNIVLNMMIGIRMASSRANSESLRNVESYDFIMKEKFSILPRTRGLLDFQDEKKMEVMRFIDYAPMVFRQLRTYFGITSEEYLNSVGPEQFLGNLILGNLSSLSELISEGKSGALFYYTADGRFMLKTITRETAKSLRQWLPKYYKHCLTNPDTLLTRYFGLHSIRIKTQNRPHNINTKKWFFFGDKLYFVVMENFFHSHFEIHRRYDIKGSRIGRSIPLEKHSDKAITLKDLDILQKGDKIQISSEKKNILFEQLRKDCELLKNHGLMDYSLLLGIYDSSLSNEPFKDFFFADLSSHKTNMNSPKLPFHRSDYGGMLSEDKTKLYCLGIIDIFTKWNTSKKLEFIFKSISTGNRTEISCVNPNFYCTRFLKFIDDLIESQ